MSLRIPSMTRSASATRRPSRERSTKLTKSRSSSQAPTPNRLSRRPSKLDQYLEKSSRRTSSVNLVIDNERVPAGIQTKDVKRWDGIQRMTFCWDSLRRDNDIWLPNGDCLVYLHEKGSSRRGASLRVSVADLQSCECRPLLDRYGLSLRDPAQQMLSDADPRLSRYSAYYEELAPQYELFIPAPSHLSREEAHQYHLTTRNFFAWIYNRPLVGEQLGQALIRLHARLDEYRACQQGNQEGVSVFMEDQGYLDFRQCPDHALALLQYAEHYQLRDLWIDAFVHCAGMHDELETSVEFENVSRGSQALITRAHIEMDIRIERAGRSLSDFLEADVPAVHVTFDKRANVHLERFRSFLQCYYVGRYGYWPPVMDSIRSDAMPKNVYQSMYCDLRNLYEYLADQRPDRRSDNNWPLDDGIDVAAAVQSFDSKNRYTALPRSCCLLPQVAGTTQRRKSIWAIFSYGQAKKERRLAAFAALKAATNHHDHRVMSSNIVREYLRFERDWVMLDDPNISCVEARKVRWILVYAMLQTLISVAKVPDEVRDTDGVAYPLCCQTAGTPPWTTKNAGSEEKTPLSEPKTPTVESLIDFTDLKPSPLRVMQSPTTTPPSTTSITSSASAETTQSPTPTIRAPQPVRSSSFDFLEKVENMHLSPPPAPSATDIRNRPLSLRTPSNISLTTATSPTQDGLSPDQSEQQTPDPSTPSSSSDMDGPSGWSASSSSEDDMDHNSVTETENSYRGDKPGTDSTTPHTQLKLPSERNQTLRKCPSGGSMRLSNPEVEQFLSS